MREFLSKVEKPFFYLLIFFLPLQVRYIFYQWGAQFNEWQAVYLYASDILLLIILFLWLLRKLRGENLGIKIGRAEIALGLFLIVAGISGLVAGSRWLSVYSFAKFLEFALLFLYIKYNFSKLFSLERFFQVFILSALLQSLVAVAQFIKQKSLGLKFLAESPLSPEIPGVAKIMVAGEKIIRVYGTVPHPNILAVILVLAIFGLAYLFIVRYHSLSQYKKIAYGTIFFLLFLGLFLTFARVVTIIGFACLIFWLFRLWQKTEHKKPAQIIFALLVIVYCSLVIPFWSYFSARYDMSSAGESQSLNLRVFYNQVALKFIKQEPFLGVGPGNFVWSLNDYRIVGQYYAQLQPWMYQPAHNIYLLIAAEIGILGLIYFLWFLFSLWWRATKRVLSASQDCLIYIFYFIIITGLFDHFWWDLQQGQIMFWLFLGLLAGLNLSPYSSTDRAQPSGG